MCYLLGDGFIPLQHTEAALFLPLPLKNKTIGVVWIFSKLILCNFWEDFQSVLLYYVHQILAYNFSMLYDGLWWEEGTIQCLKRKETNQNSKLHILDNNIFSAILQKNNMKWPLVQSKLNQTNAAEKEIQKNMKNVAHTQCMTDTKVPVQLWDKNLPQVEMSLNQTSRLY